MKHGLVGNDFLYGGDDDDVILGDNGDIWREVDFVKTEFPWLTYEWRSYPAPFDDEMIRSFVIRYDDIDFLGGNDTIYGGPGDDQVSPAALLICEPLHNRKVYTHWFFLPAPWSTR